MLRFPFSTSLGGLLLGGALCLTAAPVGAQTAPHGYDFTTITTIESFRKSEAKMLITPPFQGKAEVALVDGDVERLTKADIAKISENTLLINQQLSALTAAGWELVQAYAVAPSNSPGATPPITRYLFRKPRP
jgi:hypothetical protein